ncbi:MAG: esterase [Acutalibacter sp.]|nr:esterase [Acutalibacter sp.]
MKKTAFSLASKQITLYEQPDPSVIFFQPVDDHDEASLDNQVAYMEQHTDQTFALCAAKINQWGQELSPWKAPAVFGKDDFGDGAGDTLDFLADMLIPELKANYQLGEGAKKILGGYSLAGLFALWCGYQTDLFSGIAAASPSVWFPGWIDYAKEHSFHPRNAYLSLGNKEARTRNPVMATVADCIQEQHEIFRSVGVDAVLEWNQGNHFQDADIRTAKGFLHFLKTS